MARAVFFKENLLLGFAHNPEKIPGLKIIICIFPVIPVVGRTVNCQRRFLMFGLLLPLAVTVGFITEGCAMSCRPPSFGRHDENCEKDILPH